MISAFMEFVNKAREQGEALFAKFTTKDQLDRLVAACCLIAHADGKCDSAEKQKVRQLISVKLPHFDSDDIIESWKKFEGILQMDFDFGKGDLIDTIKKASDEEFSMIARAMCLIGAADGDFDDKEKAIAREVIAAMGKKPSDFGL